MPGHDKSRIVGWDKSDLDEFTCGICQDIYNRPVFVGCCRQTYCRECIENWLLVNNTCPFDRKHITSADLIETPRSINNLIGNMRIKCQFTGCQNVCKILDMEQHVNSCLFNTCSNCELPMGEHHDCIRNLKLEVKRLKGLLDETADNSDNKFLTWVKYDGKVPAGAIVGGHTKNGQVVFVGRAKLHTRYGTSKIPGSVIKFKIFLIFFIQM